MLSEVTLLAAATGCTVVRIPHFRSPLRNGLRLGRCVLAYSGVPAHFLPNARTVSFRPE
jgi:hypothetical protein